MKRSSVKELLGCLLALSLSVGVLQASAGAEGLTPAAEKVPIVVYTRQAPGPDEDGPGRLLLEQIEEGKTIRVIAGVDFDMVAPHELVASDVGAQVRDLEAVQTAVIRRVFETSETQGVLWKFKDIPFFDAGGDSGRTSPTVTGSPSGERAGR